MVGKGKNCHWTLQTSTSVPGQSHIHFLSPAQFQESEKTQWVLWAPNGAYESLAENSTERVGTRGR